MNKISKKLMPTLGLKALMTLGAVLLLCGALVGCEQPNEVPDPIFSPRDITIDLPDAEDLTEEENAIVEEIFDEYKKNGQ